MGDVVYRPNAGGCAANDAARGSMPEPSRTSAPAAIGSLAVEADIPAGSKLQIVASPRDVGGEHWFSLELKPILLKGDQG